jgi:2-polyprenyl-3-methyl-5-hydroxy-6-metoxy-1,4-benzoquinol methylase
MSLAQQLRYHVGIRLPARVRERRGIINWEALPSLHYAKQLMLRYQTKDLRGTDAASFQKKLNEFLALRDFQMEGYTDPEVQRDLSIQFHWGHDHDFGDFVLRGRTGTSHLALIAAFIDLFGAHPRRLDGKRVLDIGCWTGGTSLLLCAMGAHVVAVEEVKKYVDCLKYLKQAFDIENLEPLNMSLFECTTPEFQDAFDFVLFAGVLYHLSDPILGLRITFNCLKDGGTCLLSTAAIGGNRPFVAYEGPHVFEGSREALNRSGWNWFTPSITALRQMMTDVGYRDIQVRKVRSGAGLRAFAVGKRVHHVDMTRAGLSQRYIR